MQVWVSQEKSLRWIRWVYLHPALVSWCAGPAGTEHPGLQLLLLEVASELLWLKPPLVCGIKTDENEEFAASLELVLAGKSQL